MSVFSPSSDRTHLARWSGSALIAVATLTLAACGGGGSDGDSEPPDGGSGGVGPSVSISALEGDWLQKGCVKAGAQSFKRTLRVRITGQTAIDYFEGVLTFNGNDCAGASQAAGPTKTGTVTFARSEANQVLAAHWGELRTVIGTRSGAIWTLRPNNLLCLLGDEIPTIQPTLAAVASSVATIPADNCFTR
ncbi:hypothetical protein C8C99_0921 [Acidovorax sp. 107]|uniref:hypothetical protein n=1 Tax=Acidovorax sp. 107 TaxID=2135638 RepID=UPI000D364AD7|nr:hypothetical protein [Acidovorax sp. 107]PUA96115.1 hypothetical protein C8C99_0921 [Acidovorax sp. 107]